MYTKKVSVNNFSTYFITLVAAADDDKKGEQNLECV